MLCLFAGVTNKVVTIQKKYTIPLLDHHPLLSQNKPSFFLFDHFFIHSLFCVGTGTSLQFLKLLRGPFALFLAKGHHVKLLGLDGVIGVNVAFLG